MELFFRACGIIVITIHLYRIGAVLFFFRFEIAVTVKNYFLKLRLIREY